MLRRAAAEYLQRQERLHVAEAYRAAYASTSALDEEMEGWDQEGTWPDE